MEKNMKGTKTQISKKEGKESNRYNREYERSTTEESSHWRESISVSLSII
jgi:hypothetical protein